MVGRTGGDRDRKAETLDAELEALPVSAPSRDALARGFAHAVNNPLAALRADLETAIDVLRDDGRDPDGRFHEAIGLLNDVRRAAERIGAVIQRLHATSAPTEAPPPISERSTRGGEASPEGRRSVRVLVVDDDELVRNALRRCLRDYDVVTVDGAKGAVGRLTSGERFDVIFCDLMMPGMTGMDFHEEVARVLPEEAPRIVFLTGGPFTTRAQDFVATAPNLVIEKPFDPQRLRDVIQERLRRR